MVKNGSAPNFVRKLPLSTLTINIKEGVGESCRFWNMETGGREARVKNLENSMDVLNGGFLEV